MLFDCHYNSVLCVLWPYGLCTQSQKLIHKKMNIKIAVQSKVYQQWMCVFNYAPVI